jgi:hypothetical protein
MAKWTKLQRGSADLITVAVGLLIMAVVTAGTSAAMVYGREMLLREEHYKAAAYLLRGQMEAQQTALLIPEGRIDLSAKDHYLSKPLDLDSDRNRVGIRPVYCVFSRKKVDAIHNPQLGSTAVAYYRFTISASWTERDLAEGNRNQLKTYSMSLTTSFVPRDLL